MTKFWLHSDYILATIWLPSDYAKFLEKENAAKTICSNFLDGIIFGYYWTITTCNKASRNFFHSCPLLQRSGVSFLNSVYPNLEPCDWDWQHKVRVFVQIDAIYLFKCKFQYWLWNWRKKTFTFIQNKNGLTVIQISSDIIFWKKAFCKI